MPLKPFKIDERIGGEGDEFLEPVSPFYRPLAAGVLMKFLTGATGLCLMQWNTF